MVVRTATELERVLSHVKTLRRYCIDTETVDRGYPDITLTGVGIGWSSTDSVYIPVGHAEGAQLPLDFVMRDIRQFTEATQDVVAVMHNARYDIEVLELIGGVKFSPAIFDTMIASWLLDTENEHGLKPLSYRYLNKKMTELKEFCPIEKHPVTGDDVYRTDLVPIAKMAEYGCDDVERPLDLMDVFLPRLEADRLLKVFCELEMPKVFLLKDMETAGVRIDREALERRLIEAPKVLAGIEAKMYELRPNRQAFNANSSKQLNQILFNELKIKPIGDKGKSGLYSTDKDNMEQWVADHPLVDAILEYRQVSKLLGTYLRGWEKRIYQDGKLRTSFNPILTTGRLSSSAPNLQNIPRPDNDVFGLREMFVASPGNKLVVADYSQIELRVLAHISRDPTFISAFKNDEDLHAFAGKMLFDLPESVEEVKKLHPVERSTGKTFNFAMVFEAGVARLAASAHVSKERAQTLRDKYMARFHGIERYIEDQHAKAEKYGYVMTLTGRRRHLPDAQLRARSKEDNAAKSAAFRRASNSSIQGSAADILFIGMRNVDKRLRAEGLDKHTRLVLQVHDELIYDTEEAYAEQVKAVVKEELERAVTLRVPLIANVEIGDRWSECK